MPQRRLATRRFLATVLFTDIVGSTERAAQLGDRGWRDLVERHNALVRRELKVFGGREMDTAGDGFFAVFEAPERAVRCAESITAAVAPLGIAVRAGVHMGECEMVGGKVGGMAVVIGARIAALAGAGQVLVSGSVRDLMTGSDRHFEGGEPQTLKGVEDPWRVYRLVPDEVNAEAVASRRPSIVPLYTRRQRRRLVVALAAVLVVALAVTAGYLLTRSAPTVTVGENAVGVIGPGDEPRISAAVDVGQRPSAVASGYGSVWVTNSTDGSVSRIKPGTEVSVPVSVGASPSGVAVGAGAVWVANSGDATVSKIDPATSRTVTIPVRPGPTGIIVAAGKVWVTNTLDASISEIDPATNQVRAGLHVGASPTGIAYGAGSLWVTNQADGTVSRINPVARAVEDTITVGNGPVGIAVGDGAAWVANNLDGSLSRIDVEDNSETSRTIARSGGAYGVATWRQAVWVSSEHAGTLSRISTRRFTLLDTVRVGGAPLGLTFVQDRLWFTNAAGGSALHRGGVLTVVGPALDFDGDPGGDPTILDPIDAYGSASTRLAQLTNDGLVGYRHVAGAQGAVLVPDLATTLPDPTDGGLTYVFHVRKGVRYSTGSPVRASDVGRGIERSLLHVNRHSFNTYYAAAIKGATNCLRQVARATKTNSPGPTSCDLTDGIVADDDAGTITFHLTQRTPEFLYQLALPTASAVPGGTPLHLPAGGFLPATGPYMVKSYAPMEGEPPGQTGHGRLELVRNPRFHVWSAAAQPDSYPDRIVLLTGYDDKEALRQITDGRADLTWAPVPTGSVADLRTRYGTRMHINPGTFTRFLALNTTQPPFNNPDARRAVAWALDRNTLARVPTSFSGPVTCQVIPPDFQGYQAYCPFTTNANPDGKYTGPDVEKARDLAAHSGTAHRTVRVVISDALAADVGPKATEVVRVLKTLGYKASVRRVADDQYFTTVFDPKAFEATIIGWGADYPAASNFFVALATCKPDAFNISGFCELEGEISTALDLQVDDPGAASDAWAALDRKMVDAAAIIPLFNSQRLDFVSHRVGQVFVSPQYGPLTAAMWVQ